MICLLSTVDESQVDTFQLVRINIINNYNQRILLTAPTGLSLAQILKNKSFTSGFWRYDTSKVTHARPTGTSL